MKLKIKVKQLATGCMPTINPKGDWIDLRAAETVVMKAPQSGVLRKVTVNGETESYRDVAIDVHYIPLGVAIELPKGFEAIIASRSSAPKVLHTFIPNGQGIVDNIYCGNDDEWCFIASPLEATTINKGDRVCQFRIQLSQKATMLQKLRWLFSSGIELVEVSNLEGNNRRGFGSTGIK